MKNTNNSIRILPPDIANKIAAGEVVERPASVVKELVENSIDALSQNIILHIEDGGKGLIKVVDDGIGMSKDDLILCVERHATSKIRDIHDLERINTLGFRGEALPSIAAVSQMIIKSKKRDEKEGWQLRIDFGNKNPIEPAAVNTGTTIEVRNLFENVPARKKFLKSSQWEFQCIFQLIKTFSVSHYQLNFSLFKENKEIFVSRHKKWGKEVLLPLFDGEILDKFILSEDVFGDIKIKLIISNPEVSGTVSKNLFFFLNSRNISGKIFWKAISNACEGIFMKGTYPSGAIFIECPPHYFDVNVHPTKMEVRFQNNIDIYKIIYTSLKNTLLNSREAIFFSKDYTSSDNFKNIEIQNDTKDVKKKDRQNINDNEKNLWSEVLNNLYQEKKNEKNQETFQDSKDKFSYNFNENLTKQLNIKIIGQLLNSYIIIETNEGLQLIDQHALHEAIIYKELIEHIDSGKDYPSQLLLFPQVIDIDEEKYENFLKSKDILTKIGLILEIFGLNQLIIKGIPQINLVIQKEIPFKEFIDRILGSVTQEKSFFLQNAISFVACDMAVKSGRILNDTEMKWLINKMREKKITHCPHGRPVVILMDKKEILSRFGRK